VNRVGRRPQLAVVLLLWVLLGACGAARASTSGGAAEATLPARATRTVPRPTSTPVVQVSFVSGPPTSTPLPTAVPPPATGISMTLQSATDSVGADPEGSKTNAYNTLAAFVDPRGQYAGSWWLQNDGQADMYEVLAVILYTEGSTNMDVRAAVAARFLWYCGGLGASCSGPALINFLSYFQPWREPWMSRGFVSASAARYLEFARDIVDQRAGLLTALIPGADTYVANRTGLDQAGSIRWHLAPFHFANVHNTWDSHLRQQLRRGPNGPAGLWVLTIDEASRVCTTRFLCQDMTRPREK
jgi:hypothetical protein